MTVSVERFLRLPGIAPECAAAAIDAAVRGAAKWRLDSRSGLSWRLTNTPGGLLLPTEVVVDLIDDPSGLVVRATATSQKLIFGDIFRMYPRMITDLLQRIDQFVGPLSPPSDDAKRGDVTSQEET